MSFVPLPTPSVRPRCCCGLLPPKPSGRLGGFGLPRMWLNDDDLQARSDLWILFGRDAFVPEDHHFRFGGSISGPVGQIFAARLSVLHEGYPVVHHRSADLSSLLGLLDWLRIILTPAPGVSAATSSGLHGLGCHLFIAKSVLASYRMPDGSEGISDRFAVLGCDAIVARLRWNESQLKHPNRLARFVHLFY